MMSKAVEPSWPKEDLEWINACPYCGCVDRRLAYNDAQDWAFFCAPGTWTYWDCTRCQSLYLDPRPTASSVGRAYASYYTHANELPTTLVQALKVRLKHDYLSHLFNGNIEPRWHLPSFLLDFLSPIIKRFIVVPPELALLAMPHRGSFVDVGCGAGRMVTFAQQLGWDAMGIEIDPLAVRTAQSAGLRIEAGTYEKLHQYPQTFDFILCSHVLEHVHKPLELLAQLKAALKPGGTLLLVLPNSQSALRHHFGVNWRGLEAPRHLSIPADHSMRQQLVTLGFTLRSIADSHLDTAADSFRIARRGTDVTQDDLENVKTLRQTLTVDSNSNDFIKLVCHLPVGAGSTASRACP